MNFIIFAVALFSSLFLIAKIGPHVHRFKWAEYCELLFIPLLAVAILVYVEGFGVAYVFFASAIMGTAAEYSFGRAYHSVMGKRLWEYWRYSIQGYTSILVVPLWGLAGVFFFLLSNALGI